MKTQRHAAILKIVRRERVASQERLRELLKGEGFAVTQATLSRDIRDLGLAKVAAPDGGSHYAPPRSEEHTSELQSQSNLVCRLLLEKKKKNNKTETKHSDIVTSRQQ